MTSFSQEIYQLVSSGLAELAQAQRDGKTPDNPISETHFFSAWVTKSLKTHRFEPCVGFSLKHWQRQARTQGANAQLKQQFLDVARTYRPILRQHNLGVYHSQIEALITQAVAANWIVTTDIVIGAKFNLKSSWMSSLVVCAKQFGEVFDKKGQLIAPLSLYIRGEKQALIDLSHRGNLLLHRVSDYKSKVKYHGEFIIYPNNDGIDLPCIPSC